MRRGIWALCLVVSLNGAAKEPSELQRLRDRIQEGCVYRMSFVQRSTSAMMGQDQTARGTLTLARPARLRWDYEQPDRHSLLVNGRDLVLRLPEERMAYVGRLSSVADFRSPLTFLTGEGSLAKEFRIESLPGPRDYRLTPLQPDAQLQALEIRLREDGAPLSVILLDVLGSRTVIEFGDLETVEPRRGWDSIPLPADYECLDFSGLPIPCPRGDDA